jgi:putative transposase
VVQRGHSRSRVFFQDSDYRRYRATWREIAPLCGVAIHGYVLMTNHVHLLVTPARAESLPRAMHAVNRRYVHPVNRREERTGSLWEGRYRAAAIDSEDYFLACLRYIELNPVRAGISADPARYPWSSYACHAIGDPDDLVSEHALYRALGPTPEQRLQAYAGLVALALPDDVLGSIRAATQANQPIC